LADYAIFEDSAQKIDCSDWLCGKVRRPETKCRLCPPLQIWEARIRLAWRGSARH